MKKIIILLGLCLVCLALSGCGDMATGLDYLVTGNTSSQQSSGSDYRSIAYQDAQDAGIPANLYVRQINQESGFNPGSVSSAGAIGIAQIIPSTAASWNVDPWDPVASLKVAADHMHWYYVHYGYSYSKALSCYNAGCGSLESAEARCGYGWQTCVPSETQRYISAIMG
jgi:soluble lytic murein transglycosylase-like protein